MPDSFDESSRSPFDESSRSPSDDDSGSPRPIARIGVGLAAAPAALTFGGRAGLSLPAPIVR